MPSLSTLRRTILLVGIFETKSVIKSRNLQPDWISLSQVLIILTTIHGFRTRLWNNSLLAPIKWANPVVSFSPTSCFLYPDLFKTHILPP